MPSPDRTERERCHDCGDPDIAIIVDDDDPPVGYRGEVAFCTRCALARGLITLAELGS